MGRPTDFYDDLNQQHLYTLDHLYGLPEFVKKAGQEQPSDIAALPSDAFADPRNRKFPTHTKEATWLSNAYFQEARPVYQKREADFIQDRLLKSASYWSIRNLVDRFNQVWHKFASFDRPELDDSQYALVTQTNEGHKIRRFHMPNAVSVKWAGEHLYANRYKYPYEWRKSAARRILREAIKYDDLHKKGEAVPGAALGATRFDPVVQDYLERAAGFATSHPMAAAEKIAQRMIMLKQSHMAHAKKLAELADQVRTLPTISPAQLQKLAHIIDTVDRETGLYNHYATGVDMPEDMFFDILEKEASSILDSHVTLTTGHSYPLGAIMQLPLEKLASVLGTEFVDAVSAADGMSIDTKKFAEVLPTLPRTDAVLLEKAIDEMMRGPIEKGARAGLMSREAFTKESVTAQLKAEGRKIEDRDFSLTAVLK